MLGRIKCNETVVRLLKVYDKINTESANSLKSVQALMKDQTFDVVMIYGGLSNEEEDLLIQLRKENNPNVNIIEHFGGGSGLLLSEIKQTLTI